MKLRLTILIDLIWSHSQSNRSSVQLVERYSSPLTIRVSILLQCVNFPLFKLLMFQVVILISNKLHSQSEEEKLKRNMSKRDSMLIFNYYTSSEHK